MGSSTVVRTKDVSVLEAKRYLLDGETIGFQPEVLLENGFAVFCGDDVMLFEWKADGVYAIHYLLESRGKAAVDFCLKALEKGFEEARVILGLTPVDNKKALWMNRRLGGTPGEIFETPVGDHQLFYLTKETFNEQALRRQ